MDNLISRQAAIDLVRDVCEAILSGCGSHYDGEDEVYDDLLEVDAILKCNKEIRIALANMPPAQPLTDEDYIELHDRFGTWVEEVVRDMISGEGKRWGNERRHDQQTGGD